MKHIRGGPVDMSCSGMLSKDTLDGGYLELGTSLQYMSRHVYTGKYSGNILKSAKIMSPVRRMAG